MSSIANIAINVIAVTYYNNTDNNSNNSNNSSNYDNDDIDNNNISSLSYSLLLPLATITIIFIYYFLWINLPLFHLVFVIHPFSPCFYPSSRRPRQSWIAEK